MQILISAGEASGEMYGAQLMEALRRRDPSLTFFGAGGERMRAAGCEIVVDAKDLAVVGITEILSHLPKIYGLFRKLIRAADEKKPKLADRHRCARVQLARGPADAQARHSCRVLRVSAVLGVAAGTRETAAQVRQPGAGDFSV